MKRWRLLPALALLGWSAGAAARPLPNTAQIQAALDAHEACRGAGNMACNPPLRYRLTRSHCYDLEDPNDPGRILCRYSTFLSGRGAPRHFLRHDCAYLRRDTAGGWRIDAYPDADMCEE